MDFSEIKYHFNQQPPATRRILFICVGIFLVQFTLISILGYLGQFMLFFAYVPYYTVFKWQIWRPFTYMFVHADGMHLLFNMLALWFFAPEIEFRWGTRKFTRFVFLTGVGAAVFHTFFSAAVGLIRLRMGSGVSGEVFGSPIIGFSGVIYGILVANMIYYPNRTVLVNFLLPMKMKYFVIILMLLEFFSTVNSANGIGGVRDNISHITHLGGALVAFLYIKLPELYDRIRYGKGKVVYWRGE